MLKGVICVCVVKNRNSFFKYIICNYKAKVSSYFNALYETCFGVSGKCFYAFIYTGPNYWPDKCKYRVQNANKQIKQTSFTECAEVLQNILFSLTVGVNKPQAIFFLTTESTHYTRGACLGWTEMQQTSQRNSYHGDLQEITGPAGNVRMTTDESEALRLNGH